MLDCRLAFALTFCAMASCADGAAIDIVVVDRAASPVSNAVVMLEPTTGRLSVSPMTGVRITQSKRQFIPQVTVVTVGTPVTFPNLDTVRHHVYSFSPIKPFELKLYAGVPASPVVFDKPGIAVLGCNIHDHMVAWVIVVDTPLHVRSDAAGRARIEDVAAGSYHLRIWHSDLPAGSRPISMPLTVAAVDMNKRVTLSVDPSK
jgi:plastocyanin